MKKLCLLLVCLCLLLTGCADRTAAEVGQPSADPLATLSPTHSATPTPSPTATPVPTVTPSGESNIYVHGHLTEVPARTGANGILYLPLGAVCDLLPGVSVSTDEAGETWLISTPHTHITLRLDESGATIALGAQAVPTSASDVLLEDDTLYLTYSLMGVLLGTEATVNPAGDVLLAMPTPTPEPTAEPTEEPSASPEN